LPKIFSVGNMPYSIILCTYFIKTKLKRKTSLSFNERNCKEQKFIARDWVDTGTIGVRSHGSLRPVDHSVETISSSCREDEQNQA
jgi:hypothetical protein